MYRQIIGTNGQIRTNIILRVSDNANIPNDILNKDWVAYQAWLGQGNTPLAAS